jgi:protein SCO1/2
MHSTQSRVSLMLAGLALAVTACGPATDGTGAGAAESDGEGGPPVVMGQEPASDLHGTVVDPPLPRPEEDLRDTRGRRFSLDDRPADELTVLFFGYTHCPDVCPTTMADLAAARSQLPEALREDVTVVFVSEDPERDSPRTLRTWLDGFDTSFVGLRGGNKKTRAMLEELYLPETARVDNPQEPVEHPDDGADHHQHDDYGVDHAGVVYAFGPGDTTVLYSGGTTPSEYAADFQSILGGGSAR